MGGIKILHDTQCDAGSLPQIEKELIFDAKNAYRALNGDLIPLLLPPPQLCMKPPSELVPACYVLRDVPGHSQSTSAQRRSAH